MRLRVVPIVGEVAYFVGDGGGEFGVIEQGAEAVGDV